MPRHTAVGKEHYGLLAQLWSSGWNEYQSLGSGFVTAHSILLGGIILLLLDGDRTRHSILAVLVSAAGLFLALQMKGALGKCSAKANYFSWQLRGIEASDDCSSLGIFEALEHHLEGGSGRGILKNRLFDGSGNIDDLYTRNYATTFHRRPWLRRMASLPAVFAAAYYSTAVVAGWSLFRNWDELSGGPRWVAPPWLALVGAIASLLLVVVTAFVVLPKMQRWERRHTKRKEKTKDQ